MSTAPAKIRVFVGEHFACIKIEGRANFTSSVDFRTLVNELLQKNYRYFVLDLCECTLMDSTFLGVLAGFGLKGCVNKQTPGCITIEVLNPNERIMELLESLGVLHLFKVVRAPIQGCESAESSALTPTAPTKEEVTRACLEAHQTLMGLNPQNAAKFKEVAAFLAEDLKKARTGP
jgi:anti-anti-sigma regulatory factor